MELIECKDSNHITSGLLGPRAPARSSAQSHESSHFQFPLVGSAPAPFHLPVFPTWLPPGRPPALWAPRPPTTRYTVFLSLNSWRKNLIDCSGSQLWVGKLSRMDDGEIMWLIKYSMQDQEFIPGGPDCLLCGALRKKWIVHLFTRHLPAARQSTKCWGYRRYVLRNLGSNGRVLQ